MTNHINSFDAVTIQEIFGHEAAESEDIQRLKEYYFKSKDYKSITAELPLRILVGHKGIGKSALFKVAHFEDSERHRLAIWIRPDDVLELGTSQSGFLELIRDWKVGLNNIIADKVLSGLGMTEDPSESSVKLKSYGGKLLMFLQDTLKPTTQSSLTFDPVNKLVVENFLKTQKINVYIDDLDRGWRGKPEDIVRISALLNALRDLAAENSGLHFRVALRSDVYFLVRTSDESTDKIEGSVVWQSWTNHDILALLVKRIETYFGRSVDEKSLLNVSQPTLAKYLEPLMEPRFRGRGKWENAPMYRILMSLIRKRPRDLVKLCSLAATNAYENGQKVIKTEHFQTIFEQYSQGRLQDTVNEYKTELPQIEALLYGMKPTKKEHLASLSYVYKTDMLLAKIDTIMSRYDFRLATGKTPTKRELAQFLYKINFLTARKELPSGEIQRKYFEEHQYIYSKFADFGYDWEVHPAYRWALEPDDLQTIFLHLDLSNDD